MKFIADCMLGKLARWLRILGYDTVYHTFAEDDHLLEQARSENRILLTQDGPLFERAPQDCCIHIDHNTLEDQMAQLVQTLGLTLDREPFTRCLTCNTPLVQITPQEARDQVPPYVFQTQKRFFKCPTDNQVFWRGTHVDRMDEHLDRIKARVVEGGTL